MLAIERRNEILEKLQFQKKVVVSELSRTYGVSEETIRRDLEKLEKDGFAIKSYGGAVVNENTNIELPLNLRKKKHVPGKKKIAELICNEIIKDNDRIILDASSTAVYISKLLKMKKKNITLITNSIEILVELYAVPGWRIISTGGETKERTFALVGAVTEKVLEGYHVEKAIVSCKGFDLEAGMTDSDEMHAKNKQTMLRCGKERILAVDSSKFGQIAFVKIGDISDVTKIVTDEKPKEEWLRICKSMGIICMYPGWQQEEGEC